MESTPRLCFIFSHYYNHSFDRSVASACLRHLPLLLYLPKQTSENLLNTREQRQKPQHLHLGFFPSTRFKLSRRRCFRSLSPCIGSSFQRLPYNQPPVSLTLTNAYFSKKPKLAASGSPPPLKGGHPEALPPPSTRKSQVP